MSVRSPTAGTWSSSQWRPDNEFETDTIRRWPGATAVWRAPYRIARQNELFFPCSRRNLAS